VIREKTFDLKLQKNC